MEMTLFTRLLVSLSVFCLNASRLLVTFIAPAHRKRIEEAMRGVNMVIVEEKYFWKIYEAAWSSPKAGADSGMMAMPTSPTANMAKSTLQVSKSTAEMKESLRNVGKATPKKEAVIRAKVAEYIEINLSMVNTQGNRKFTFYRNIDLVYNAETSALTVISEDDGRSSSHVLEEIMVVEELMLQLLCEDEEEPMYVKFRSKKEMELFMNSISLQS